MFICYVHGWNSRDSLCPKCHPVFFSTNATSITTDSIIGIQKSYLDTLQARVRELEVKLSEVDRLLEGLSSGGEMGTDCNTSGEKAKRYAHQIQMEIRAALEKK